MNSQHVELGEIEERAGGRFLAFEGGLPRRLYTRVAGGMNLSALGRQRLKMLYFAWAYWRLFTIPGLPALRLTRDFLRVDFNVLHGHLPSEMVAIARDLAGRRAGPGEVVVEAGCWKGGSSAKLSILCDLFGYSLLIYDSFEGVEVLSGEDQAKEWDYAGQYASAEPVLWENLGRYGKPGVCSAFKGWFSETLAANPVGRPVKLVYIDCDLGKGTYEALQGVAGALVADGSIFSQDFHIAPVRAVLLDPETWHSLGRPVPEIRPEGVHLARIAWRA